MNTLHLRARRGESVRQKWDRLVLWVASLKVIAPPDALVKMTKHGTIVRLRRKDRFNHPWRVSADSLTAAISTGRVNGVVPSIREKGKLRRMDNRKANGELDLENVAPVLTLNLKDASKDGEIFISLKVKPSLSAEGFEITVDEDTEEPSSDAVEIVQTSSASGPRDGHSYYPLAVLHLASDGKSVEKVFPIAHHNLRFTFQERNATEKEIEAGSETKIGRGIFYPASISERNRGRQ